ncbi:MAG: ADP-glyceromanno-heptose 6-epimerase [Planctomycetes bacterium]|nr:ADP-glyceromanno-heptose 6-epimerase [Planctomycetota bacterium]MCB9919768.1 ADP-glyceromanno-heptose 6-epimerase [Planctomycetota bacterium]
MSLPLLVTGAAGFIGARFVESCNARGIPVVSVDVRSAFTRPEHDGILWGEIVDRDELFDRLAGDLGEQTFAGIVHLGACSATTELDLDFLERVNVDYSKKLWNYACSHDVPFVYASSAATYGAGELGYSDDESKFEQLKPLNPYGDSKRRFDIWAIAQEREGNTPPAWCGFKFFNVYGFGERHKGPMASVVVKAYDQIKDRGIVRLFRSHKDGIADGHQSRDFIWVGDVIDVLHWSLDMPLERGVYNLGTGTARSFLALVNATFAAMDVEPHIEWIDTPVELRERYQYFTEADMGRLREAGYSRAFTKLEEGVRRTVEAMRAAESPTLDTTGTSVKSDAQ